jgi:hypothetical protein
MRQIILYLLAAAAVLISREVNAQDCPNFSLTFNRQSALDSFPIRFPECRETRFQVTVTGDDITDLTPLCRVKRFNSNLDIINNTSLQALPIFDSTEFIYSLEINNCSKIKNLKGLERVSGIDILRILNNKSFDSFDGLSGLSKIPQILFIANNERLEIIDNLPKSDTIRDFTIRQNKALTEVRCWDSLKVVMGIIIIDDNVRLKSIDQLNSLREVKGNLRIVNIDSIFYLPDFDSLTNVGVDLTISGKNTPSSKCKSKNIPRFPSLSFVGNTLRISSLYNSETKDYDGLNNLQTVKEIDFALNACTNISGFNNLTSVSGRIFIDGYSNLYDLYLEEISGFNRLETVGQIYLKSNVELKKFTGFRNLRRVETDLNLYGASLNLETFEGSCQSGVCGQEMQI